MLSKNSINTKKTDLLFKTEIIKDSYNLLKIFCCFVIVVLICIMIGHYAFKNGILTCDHYVFNTYLYIILAISLIFLIVLLNDQYGIFNPILNILFSSGGFIPLFVLICILIALTYALHTVNPNNILASNAIWLGLVILIGIILIPIILFGRLIGVVGLASILTVVIVIVVGLLGYYIGDKIITFDWDYYLRFGLVALVVISILGYIFIKDSETMITFMYIISIISLVIFVLLLLSNHKKLKEHSQQCIDGQVVPNYPKESWGLVIKIVNIFRDLITILGVRKLRRRR
jgi:hypothetical protein